jgi:uncharacterized protein (DUF488 family)
MLNRQRIVLFTLNEAGGHASRLQVVKWLFLLGQETPNRGGEAFYQFVPYQYGPFSFCLYHEATRLGDGGLLTEHDAQTWSVTAEGKNIAAVLPESLRDDVVQVLTQYGSHTLGELMGYVYDRYPWFTVNSLNDPRCSRPTNKLAVYTAGYEGLLVDGFLNRLLHHGIERVIDVRNNPVSRRYGFHGGTLSRLCSRLGMEYVHFPDLGIPPEDRQGLMGPSDYRALFRRYEDAVLPTRVASVGKVASLLSEKPGVLVCSESDPEQCHRSRLARVVAARCGLPVEHLEPAA